MNLVFKLFFLAIISPLMLFGQAEANNWYFGSNAGVRFNADGTVTPLNDGQLNTYEGSATISDSLGNLLFYTEGTTVYNRNHNIMDNGTGLFGGESSTQSAIIVPWPKNPTLYFIFTVQPKPVDLPGVGLNYSVVDISLDGGNGSVIQKNINLLVESAEKITAVVKDCTAESLWLITLSTADDSTRRPFNTYHAFEISPAGVDPNPISSTFSSLNINYVGGYLKLSPDGTKLASANMDSGLFIYDFDTNTGIVSNQQQININHQTDQFAYGIEFSPSGEFLYVHTSNHRNALTGHTASLFQYDLQAADISGSQFLIDASRDLYRGALQLGPNGKIYRALTETYLIGTPYLGVIHNPDELGALANYEHNAVNLGNNCYQGLPPFVQSFFDTVFLVPEDTDANSDFVVCEDQPISLTPQFIPGATYTWAKDGVEFENPENHTLTIPIASMTDAGNYTVTIVRPTAIECPITGELSLVVNANPTFSDNRILTCDLDEDDTTDGITTIDLTQLENDINLTYSYYQTVEDRNNDEVINTPNAFRNLVPFNQTIFYKVTNNQGCIYEGLIETYVRESPILALEENYTICVESPNLVLEGTAGFDSYSWIKVIGNQEEIISEDRRFKIIEVGEYILEASVNNIINGEIISCSSRAAFEVLPSTNFEINDIIATGDQFQIILSKDGDFEYSLDRTNFQESNVFNIPDVNEFIFVREKNGCLVIENVKEKYAFFSNGIFPLFFTPNGDGINDYWQYIAPITPGTAPDLESINIFDRYGKLVYYLKPESIGWNGTSSGRPLPASDYWYKAIFKGGSIKYGHFTLKR